MSISQNAATAPHIPGEWRFKGITESGFPLVFYVHDVGVSIFTKRTIAEYAVLRGCEYASDRF